MGMKVWERGLSFTQSRYYLYGAWVLPSVLRGFGAVVLVVIVDVKGWEQGTFASAFLTSTSTTSKSVLHIVILCKSSTGKGDESSFKKRVKTTMVDSEVPSKDQELRNVLLV